MADPITIIGAFAAATQLAENGLELTLFLCELGSQIRRSQDATNQRIGQLRHLTSIARLIISNPMLQTDEMGSILQACFKETGKLEKILQNIRRFSTDKRGIRLRRSWRAVWKEKEINTHFRNLEQMKGMIGLCISERISNLEPIIYKTSSTLTTVADNIPAILENSAVIEQKLPKMDRNSGNLVGKWNVQLEPLIQQLLMNQKESSIFPNFGSKVSTHYDIPPPPSGTFTGFSDTILTLKQHFSTNDLTTKRLVTLAGVRCGGKSQVALEFCYQAQREGSFGAIFWVKAASTTSIEKALNGIAETFNIPKQEFSQSKLGTFKAILSA